jgi:hypothetical protein
MTQAKKVATTLKTVLDNDIMKDIMNKNSDIDNTITEVSSWWKYDLFSRKPGPAYEDDGTFLGTDLDLACFLYELSDRGAIINLPEYKSLRKTRIKEGQHIVSKENRHGCLLGLNANKNTFVFSIKIKDMNVMTSESVGDYRNFSLTDFSGKWYDGWKKIEFIPSAKENNFLTESKILEGNHITFKNFSHPNRWTSFFGQYYFITKCLIDRLIEESTYYNSEIKKMLEEGIRYPVSEIPTEWPKQESEKGKSIKVKAFNVEIDIPENDTNFPVYEHNQENLVKLTRLRKQYVYKIIPRLRFATRATELSYYNTKSDVLPAWLKDVKWEKDYVVPGKRTKWERLVLFQPAVGERGVSIRKREFEKSEIVNANYEEY